MTGATVVRRARVEGRVQGVYFRASTAERARSLGISGYARNLPDGAVEVLAAGPAVAVGQLLEWLWQGPALARVDAVTVEEAGDVAVPQGFHSR